MKKIKCVLASIIILAILVGCNRDLEYFPYVGEFGPNELNNKYFYHYIRKKPYFRSVLARYDVDDMEDMEIYVVDDPDNQRVEDYYGFDDGVFFVVNEYKVVEDETFYYENTLIFHDNESEQNQTIIVSTDDILFIKDKEGLKIELADKYYSIEKTEDEYSLEETSVSFGEKYPPYKTVLEFETDEGLKVIFSKEYDNADFIFQVGDKTGTIDALRGRYSSKSAISDNYIIENGKVIGTVQYTNIFIGRFEDAEIYTYPNELKGEVLYEFDLQTCESRILYRIKGNKKLIIGYRDGQVYLYSKGKVIEHALDSGKENVILEIDDNPEDQLSFNWIGNTIVIYNDDNYGVVESVKVEN